jgi:hypothetical protein|tara:strand:+ start:317 stop:484 length:168 start_codon:yes stop_codon:yes gene_type:complete
MSFKLKRMKQLDDNFKISDKQLMILIENLFEMVKDNNKLINLLDERIKLLESEDK